MSDAYTPKHQSGLKTESDWNELTNPIPKDVVILTTDTQKFKRGDGVHRFVDLPDGPTVEGINEGVQSLANIITELFVGNENQIIIVDGEIYIASGTTQSDLSNRLSSVASRDTLQTADLDTIQSQYSLLGSVGIGSEGKLVITDNKQLNVGIGWEEMLTGTPPVPIMIRGIEAYLTDELLDSSDVLRQGQTYFVQVNALHDNADLDELSISLVADHPAVIISAIGRDIFEVEVGALGEEGDIVLTGTATYEADTVQQAVVLFGEIL